MNTPNPLAALRPCGVATTHRYRRVGYSDILCCVRCGQGKRDIVGVTLTPADVLMSKGEADARIDLMKMTQQRDDLLEAISTHQPAERMPGFPKQHGGTLEDWLSIDGKWHHIAVILGPLPRVFIDGSDAHPQDEITMYDRVLSSDEIAANFATITTQPTDVLRDAILRFLSEDTRATAETRTILRAALLEKP